MMMGVAFARSTFEVGTLGEEFVVDAAGECTVSDFPAPGETTTLEWNQATQHLEVVSEATQSGGVEDLSGIRERATQMPLPSSQQEGYLSQGAVDYFAVTLTERGGIEVETGGIIDTKGSLFDSGGRLLEQDDDGGRDTNFRIVRTLEAGTYFIRVSGASDETTGSYRLRVVFRIGEGRDEDDSHTQEGATRVGVPSDTRRYIGGGDVDYFQITLTQPGMLLVQTTGTANTLGSLQESSGRVLARYDDGGEGTNFRIEANVRAGTYYIAVSRGLIPPMPGQYVLQVRFRAVAGGAISGWDPGDSRAGAVLLDASAGSTGNSHQYLERGDVDYFVITIPEPGVLSARTDDVNGDEIDTRGAVEDWEGRELVRNNDYSDRFKTFSLWIWVTPGTYYIRVEGQSPSVSGPYNLWVSFNAYRRIQERCGTPQGRGANACRIWVPGGHVNGSTNSEEFDCLAAGGSRTQCGIEPRTSPECTVFIDGCGRCTDGSRYYVPQADEYIHSRGDRTGSHCYGGAGGTGDGTGTGAGGTGGSTGTGAGGTGGDTGGGGDGADSVLEDLLDQMEVACGDRYRGTRDERDHSRFYCMRAYIAECRIRLGIDVQHETEVREGQCFLIRRGGGADCPHCP